MHRTEARKRARTSPDTEERPAIKSQKIHHEDGCSSADVQFDSDTEQNNDIYNDHDIRTAENLKNTGIMKLLPATSILYKRWANIARNVDLNLFDALEDKTIKAILGYLSHRSLSALSQTSRRFHRLCKDSSLWIRLDLTSRKLDEDAIGYILLKGVKILRLNSTTLPSPLWSVQLESTLESYLSKVMYLDLSYAWIKTADLSLLLGKMRRLLKLSLETLTVDATVMKQVAKNNDLDTLNLAMASGLDVACIELLTNNLPKLVSLNISWTSLDSCPFSVLCHKLSTGIRQLDISGAQDRLKNEDLVVLVKRCLRLKSLDVSDNIGLSVGTLREIIKNLKDLTSLKISRCYQIEANYLVELKKLEKLQILAAYNLIPENVLDELCALLSTVNINRNPCSVIARPTVGIRRTSIWEEATRR